MTARLPALPDGYMQCTWCGHGIRLAADGGIPSRCSNCGLFPAQKSPNAASATEKKPRAKSTTGAKDRRKSPRQIPFDTDLTGNRVIGVDPGARYTGIVIRDGDTPLYSATLVRDKDTAPGVWAREVIVFLRGLLAEWGDMPMGVEGVSDPKGFKGGERAALNPAHIMRAAVVFGAVAAVWPDSVIIPPGGNGSQHESHYPDSMRGRRPKDLPGSNTGAGTRAHEQSAYDVAGKAWKIFYPSELPGLR